MYYVWVDKGEHGRNTNNDELNRSDAMYFVRMCQGICSQSWAHVDQQPLPETSGLVITIGSVTAITLTLTITITVIIN